MPSSSSLDEKRAQMREAQGAASASPGAKRDEGEVEQERKHRRYHSVLNCRAHDLVDSHHPGADDGNGDELGQLPYGSLTDRAAWTPRRPVLAYAAGQTGPVKGSHGFARSSNQSTSISAQVV